MRYREAHLNLVVRPCVDFFCMSRLGATCIGVRPRMQGEYRRESTDDHARIKEQLAEVVFMPGAFGQQENWRDLDVPLLVECLQTAGGTLHSQGLIEWGWSFKSQQNPRKQVKCGRVAVAGARLVCVYLCVYQHKLLG